MFHFTPPTQFNKTPIVREFIAAGRLANEWRDTILYTTLTALAVTNVMSFSEALDFANYRELARGVAWTHGPLPMKIAGNHERKSYNPLELKMSAWTGANAVTLLWDASRYVDPSKHSNIMFVGISLSFLAGSLFFAGGPKNVFQIYKDVMWDYPRKNGGGGGGTTQTKRMKDGFKKWAAKAGERFGGGIPEPARKTAELAIQQLNPNKLAKS